MSVARIPKELDDYIRDEAETSGYQLVDVTTRGGRSFSMEVVVDKEGGIMLDECAELNRKLTAWIDEKDLFPEGYTIDVSSPGLDRVLKSDSEFLWALGKKVIVNTYEPVDERKKIVGRLVESNTGGALTVEEEGGNKVSIARDNVAKAQLEVDI